jgi:hypothetical protein
MELESAARELKILAGRERLTAPELDRAKGLMTELKGLGMSNPDIVELAGGRWSESTIKGYTRGVIPADPEPWLSTVALFSRMLSANLTLADVSEALSIAAKLEGMGSSLVDVVGFMEDLKSKETSLDQLNKAIDIERRLEQVGTSPAKVAGFFEGLEGEDIDIPAFVLLLHDWHEAGLTPVEARSALSYKEQLQQAGLDINAMSHVAEAAGKFGGQGEVLEAVAKSAALRSWTGRCRTDERSSITRNLKWRT